MKIKRKKSEKISSIFILIFTSFLIIFFTFSNIKIEKEKKELNKKIENLTAELQQLKEKKKNLEETLLKIKTEEYWENLAREEGYVREGEEAIIIKKIENEEKKRTSQESFWFKIFDFLKRKTEFMK